MAESNPAEDLNLGPNAANDNQENPDSAKDKGLTDEDVKRMKNEGLSTKDLANERMKLKATAQAEMKDLVTAKGDRAPVINTKEYTDLQRELDATNSPSETQRILDKIKGISQQKENAAQQDKEKARELNPEDTQLIALQKKFDKVCDDNHELIGEGQVAGFKAWFEQERMKKPTVAHLEEQLKKMEGKEIEDRNGLAPRRKEYEKLSTLFKKHGLDSPQDNDFIKKEGLSERQDFRKKAEALEDHFSKVKDTGFYSPEKIKEMMKENLKDSTPEKLADNLKMATEVARKESEGFTHLNEQITVGGVTIHKLSEESKKQYLQYYKGLSLKDRKEKGVDQWQAMVDNEGALAKHSDKSSVYADHGVQSLDQIYKDNPDALRLAVQGFEHLDFMQKVDALKKHAVLVKVAKNKEELEHNLTIQAISGRLDKATSDKNISQKTRDRYLQFFKNENNFMNPDTKKPGDMKEFKKAYDIFISPTPDEKHKNLAAYEARRKEYVKELKKLQEINPAISAEDIKKWQAKYDAEGWTKREQIHKEELLPKIAKENEDRKKRIGLEEKAGMKKEDKEKTKENVAGLAETITAVSELMANDQGAEAMKKLLEFNENTPDNPKILFWMQTVANYMKEFGSGKKREATVEKELEQELDKIATTDKGTQDELLEQQIKTLQMEGVKQSEQRHNQTISGQERARKESMTRVQQGSVEGELTADAYKKLGKNFMVDKEGKAKKIEEIQFKDNNLKMQEQDRFRMKRETFKEQTKLDKKEGMFTAMKDKQGNVIAHQVAANLQKAELEKLEKEMAEKAQKKVESRTTSNDSQANNVFDIQTRIAARRKAKELIDEKRKERLRAA
jgi:hypothetical protein